ncbi:nucleotide-binding protein [Leeuwenhoekiella sp. MAR_2009_132]|uniref:nucleotide-binding protein n=1 Tax=Leeuwenhoekiella sp. MAR_2009_132 TaxID=1392489 RepID=UPI00068C585E|nr:nucleotide-binding protein [Leeuwenhoekiella sp. MAR_2009_132]
MKPRIFIGSSIEALDIAYAIQENLQYDSNPTVWTQGIFQLSNSSLDDLINALENFDFGIFVFKPDDIIEIRKEKLNTVRDNVIFELGLFIGRLGKRKVFFIIPNSTKNFHLPTDLIGVNPGKYDDERSDHNLIAALGPFCNQVRNELQSFIMENLEDIQDEPNYIKQIVIKKSKYWEFEFASKLLESRLKKINQTYIEIEEGLVIQRTKRVTDKEFFYWVKDVTLPDLKNFVDLFQSCANKLIEGFGEFGTPGVPIEIKNSIDRIDQLCKELIRWEYELNCLVVPEELQHIKINLQLLTKSLIVNDLNKLQKDLQNVVDFQSNELEINFTPKLPDTFQNVIKDFEIYFDI